MLAFPALTSSKISVQALVFYFLSVPYWPLPKLPLSLQKTTHALPMHITSATFVKSSTNLEQLPSPNYPEQAFVGRSNVGKSSLINMLLNRKNLAHTSSTPGKTQLINHYLINESWYLVDLPGYGYARTSKKHRDEFSRMIGDYLSAREAVLNTYVLVDSRHEPQSLDIDFMIDMTSNGLPFTLVFTKIDKLPAPKLEANLLHYQSVLSEMYEELPPIILSSATKGTGRDELLARVEAVNQLW
jgi:GTP-binding protein